jgi:hypothetical protein
MPCNGTGKALAFAATVIAGRLLKILHVLAAMPMLELRQSSKDCLHVVGACDVDT